MKITQNFCPIKIEIECSQEALCLTFLIKTALENLPLTSPMGCKRIGRTLLSELPFTTEIGEVNNG